MRLQTHLARDLGLLQVLVELAQVDLVERGRAAAGKDLADLHHLLLLAALGPRLGELAQALEQERELLEVGRVEAGKARAELLDVDEERLADDDELRRCRADAVQREDRVDEVVRLVDDDDVAAGKESRQERLD